ncbi:hypothetical protein [Nonomuraea helvata]|uniref:Uncharacterized protein n=1 Tax=Nonomuraea helvata TaxID=37484 RepID=A0ABV5SA07_9ACTN
MSIQADEVALRRMENAGRDHATPRPDGVQIDPAVMAQAADAYGQVMVGPPR